MVKEKPSKSGNKTVSADHLRTLLRFMDLPRNINELKVKLVNINQWWAAKKKSEAENVSSQSRGLRALAGLLPSLELPTNSRLSKQKRLTSPKRMILRIDKKDSTADILSYQNLHILF